MIAGILDGDFCAMPETHVAGWMFVRSEGARREPIGPRIIEMP